MFLNGFHSPAAGSSEGAGVRQLRRAGRRGPCVCSVTQCPRGLGRDGQTPRLISPRLVALFSRSPPTPRRDFLAGGEAAAQQGQQQPNLEA